MSLLEVSFAFILILLCTGLSFWKGHKLERDFLTGSLRNILQLILLGHALIWIFKHASMPLSIAVAMIMTFNAAIHVRARIKTRYPGLLLDNLISVTLAIWPISFLGTWLLEAKPWWDVQLFLPLIGMLLGSTLNGVSLGVGNFCQEVHERKEEILSWIAMGATTKEATSPLMAKCLRIAMTPNMNAMLSMGIVSIPGMMTGQVIAGMSPLTAAYNQIIIMLLIVCAGYLGTFTGLTLSRKKMFNSLGQPCF